MYHCKDAMVSLLQQTYYQKFKEYFQIGLVLVFIFCSLRRPIVQWEFSMV